MSSRLEQFWHTYRWLILIGLVALTVRLYKLDNPVADWHSWRQADTASVTREYVKQGIDLLHPQYHDLSNIPSGKDNLQGYRMVEFPLFNGLVAAIVNVTGSDLVITSRLVSIAFSILTLVSLFWLVKMVSSTRLAYVTAIIFCLMPYSIYYSRVILPEPIMLGLATFSLASYVYWLKQGHWPWGVASWGALALAILLKPFVLFMAPVYLVIAWQKYGWGIWRRWELWVYGITSLVPFYLWREWIKQFPEGIPASDWLFNSNGIRLRPAWFRWLGWERLTKLMLGYFGLLVWPFNVLNRQADFWVYGAWGVGIVAYLIVIATGNVQHDYYQVLAVPIVCIVSARGFLALFDWLRNKWGQTMAILVVSVIAILSGWFAWQQVQGYFVVNHWEYVEAGQAADRLVPPEAWVIAPALGDTQFLFQTNRRGWPIGFDIDDKITKGADYYISTSDDDETRLLKQTYEVVETGERYVIIDLNQIKQPEL